MTDPTPRDAGIHDAPLRQEIERRRTFAIISHPDAGKTTLTEKLLYFGGAIQVAGAIRARKAARHTVSDWMDMERERGISVTTSVMTFEVPFRGAKPGDAPAYVNLLDTPGHVDFGEDTYRVLTAVDSALMVVDGAKGVEERTEKLLEICRLRDTPVLTFVNKLDRECREPLELMDEIESKLALTCVPLTWPIGMGKRFRGIVELATNTVHLFTPGSSEEKTLVIDSLDDPALDACVGSLADDLRGELSLLAGAAPTFDRDAFLRGRQSPLLFGSAMNNFGVRQLLEAFVELAPAPSGREAAVLTSGGGVSSTRVVAADERPFSGFVFKIQANMDPQHRDRMAFLRVCSGRFTRGMKAHHVRLGREVNLGNATTFLARTREIVEDAVAGDVIGIPNHGTIKIGDTFTDGEPLRFLGIPSFAPEIFRRVALKSPLRAKALAKGLTQLAEEGAIQVFRPLLGSAFIVGVVGQLQLEVMKSRLSAEYAVDADYEPVEYSTARWIEVAHGVSKEDARKLLEDFQKKNELNLAHDAHGDLAYLAPNKWNLARVAERYEQLVFKSHREHS